MTPDAARAVLAEHSNECPVCREALEVVTAAAWQTGHDSRDAIVEALMADNERLRAALADARWSVTP